MTAGDTGSFAHQTVLLEEAVAALHIEGVRKNGVYIDATFGRGGHSRRILQQLDTNGRLFAFDKDVQAVTSAQADASLMGDSRFTIWHAGFAELDRYCTQAQLPPVDGVLFDLGVSSPQLDDATRGFSFRADGPLDMRMDTTQGMNAAQWLATAAQEDIAQVIKEYGEERFAGQIARAIVARRATAPITRTKELAQIVASAVRTRERNHDPATRTFQAIRIFINQELHELERGLQAAFDWLAPQGRLTAISFHSLEDRLVKQFMQARTQIAQPDRRLPIYAKDLPLPVATLLPRVMASEAEIAANPRARSARMRTLEKTGKDGV